MESKYKFVIFILIIIIIILFIFKICFSIELSIFINIIQIVISIVTIVVAFYIAYQIYKKERRHSYKDKVFELTGKLMTNFRFKGYLPSPILFRLHMEGYPKFELPHDIEKTYHLVSHCAMGVPLTWQDLGVEKNLGEVPDDVRGGILVWCLSQIDIRIGVTINWDSKDAIYEPNLLKMSDDELYNWINKYKANTVLEFIWIAPRDSTLYYINEFAYSPIYKGTFLKIPPDRLIEKVRNFFEIYFRNLEIIIEIKNYLEKIHPEFKSQKR